MTRVILVLAGCLLMTSPAFADRAPTAEEKAAVETVLKKDGCAGGSIEVEDDDKGFEVEDVNCDDGKTYEFELDAKYMVTKKEIDD